MKWLNEKFTLAEYQQHSIENSVLLVSDEKLNWIRVSPAMADLLHQVDGLTFKEIYQELQRVDLIDQRLIIPFLSKLAKKNEHNFDFEKKSVFFLVTKRCNLSCPMCYVNAQQQNEVDKEVTLEEIERIFGELSEMEFTSITLSGGEPLLRKDIQEILLLARKYFGYVGLNTNGTLLSEEMALFLTDQRIGIMISLEGADREINDAVRGKGTQKKIMKAIQTLKDLGHKELSISMTLTSVTQEQVAPIAELCLKLDVPIQFGIFVETGRGKCNESTLAVSPEDLIRSYIDSTETEAKHRSGSYELPHFLNRCKTFCGAIYSIVNIMADGDVYPCPNLIEPEWKMGNIREQSLETIIAESPITKKISERIVQNVSECKDCSIRLICGGGCMANAYFKTENIFDCDPLCGFYKPMITAYLNNWDMARTDVENIHEIVNYFKGVYEYGTV